MLTGAGADRMQTGMQRAFGSPTGVAARLKRRQTVFSVKVEKDNIDQAKAALKKATPRLPGTFSINIVEIKKQYCIYNILTTQLNNKFKYVFNININMSFHSEIKSCIKTTTVKNITSKTFN